MGFVNKGSCRSCIELGESAPMQLVLPLLVVPSRLMKSLKVVAEFTFELKMIK